MKNVVFNDDNSIFYLVEGEDKRGHKLYFKKIGAKEGQMLYEEVDPEYHLDFHKSKDGKHLILVSSNRSISEIYCIGTSSEYQFTPKKTLLEGIEGPSFRK